MSSLKNIVLNVIKQKTISRSVKISGVGLHSGRKTTLKISPALSNTGIIYRRTDLSPPVDIKSNTNFIDTNAVLSTNLKNKDGIYIHTIEHISAALSGLGIDNIIIEMNSKEIPIMDGSAEPFVQLIRNAGITTLESNKYFLKIKKSVTIKHEDKIIKVQPYKNFLIDMKIDFKHPLIKNKHYIWHFSKSSFTRQICKARTFGFKNDIKYLKSVGYCLGGNLNCAIVLDNNKMLNKKPLRFEDEFIKHKILDLIGDLYICGYNMIGALTAYKTGHKLNTTLIKYIMNKKNTWELITTSKVT